MRRILGSGRLLVYGIALLVAIGVGIVAAVQWAVNEVQEAQERRNLTANFGDELAQFCQTQSAGEPILAIDPSATLTDADGKGWKVLVLRTDDKLRHDWHKELPSAAQAANGDELDVIICVHESFDTWEACEYTRNGDDGPTLFTVTRLQAISTVSFHDKTTGAVVDSRVLEGGFPAECPDELSVSEGTNNINYEGTAVEYNAFFETFSAILAQQ